MFTRSVRSLALQPLLRARAVRPAGLRFSSTAEEYDLAVIGAGPGGRLQRGCAGPCVACVCE